MKLLARWIENYANLKYKIKRLSNCQKWQTVSIVIRALIIKSKNFVRVKSIGFTFWLSCIAGGLFAWHSMHDDYLLVLLFTFCTTYQMLLTFFFLHLVSSSPSLTFLTLANSKQTNKHAHTRVDLVGRQPQNDLTVWLNSQHKFFSSFCNTKLRG